ncbi:MAG: phage tail tip lysozyme [Candidatus Saccharibacteria bacterium]
MIALYGLSWGSAYADATTGYSQQDLYQLGIDHYDVKDTGSCGNSATSGGTALVGGDNETQIWNYFKSQGMDDMHDAALMGNIQTETAGTWNPEIIQGGGTTDNPATVGGSTGWGIVQWTPGSKALAVAKALNISTPIFQLGTQLNMVWGQMQPNSAYAPGSNWSLSDFQAATTIDAAAQYFNRNFEISADYSEARTTNAQAILTKYGGQGAATAAAGGSTVCGNTSISPDCATADGTARILCDAKQYDPVSYSQDINIDGHEDPAVWHSRDCPVISSSCYLDCSGLVNIVIYDVYGVKLMENTKGEIADEGKYWQVVPFSAVQPGDIVQPNPDHVEIVDHIVGNEAYAFAAHTDGIPQEFQVGQWGPASEGGDGYDVGSADMADPSTATFLHYIGPGSQ